MTAEEFTEYFKLRIEDRPDFIGLKKENPWLTVEQVQELGLLHTCTYYDYPKIVAVYKAKGLKSEDALRDAHGRINPKQLIEEWTKDG